MMDTLLDNLSTLFQPARRKELYLDRLVETDNITAIKKQIVPMFRNKITNKIASKPYPDNQV